jgi:hypothetical protein
MAIKTRRKQLELLVWRSSVGDGNSMIVDYYDHEPYVVQALACWDASAQPEGWTTSPRFRGSEDAKISMRCDHDPYVVQALACWVASPQPEGWTTYPRFRGSNKWLL